METRIYYHDTDAGGVVYYGRYLAFLEEARTEFLEAKGMSIVELQKKGFLYAVRSCNIQYKKPARYGDTIVCDAKLIELKKAQMIFQQMITDKTTGDLLVEAEVVLVSLTKDFKPTPISDEIRSYLLS